MPKNNSAKKTVSYMKEASKQYSSYQYRFRKMSGLDAEKSNSEKETFFLSYGPLIDDYLNLDPNNADKIKLENSSDSPLIRSLREDYERWRSKQENNPPNGESLLEGSGNNSGIAQSQSNLIENDEPRILEPMNSVSITKIMDENSSSTKRTQLSTLVSGKKGQGVSKEKKSGLAKIAHWLYSNAKSDQNAFVNAVLSKTLREQLFIFYLVQKKRRKNPNMQDFFFSQNQYLPEVEEFKSHMIPKASTFWRGIYWHKLEESAQISAQLGALFLNYYGEKSSGSLPEIKTNNDIIQDKDVKKENENSEKEESLILLEDKKEGASIIIKEDNGGKEEILNNDPNPELSFELDKSLNELAETLIKYKAAADQVQSAPNGSKKAEASKNVSDAYSSIKEIYPKFMKSAQDYVNGLKSSLNPKSAPSPDKKTHKQRMDAVSKFPDPAMGFVKGTAGVAFKGNGIISKLNKNEFANLNQYNLDTYYLPGLNVVFGLWSVVTTVSSIWNLVNGAPKMQNLEIFTSILDVLSNFYGAFSGGVDAAKIVTNAQAALGSITQTAANSTNATLGAIGGGIGLVTGSISFIKGAVQIDKSRKGKNTLAKSISEFKTRTGGGQNALMTAEDKQEEAIQNKLLSDFNLGLWTGSFTMVGPGAISVAGGILGLICATGVGAVVAAALLAVGSIAAIAISIADFVKKKKNRARAVDEYIHLDEVHEAAKQAMLTRYGATWEKTIKKDFDISGDKGLVKQLRRELLARINCTDATAYKYVIMQHARFLYTKTFYNSAGKVFSNADRGSKDYKRAQKEYYPLLKAMRLDPKIKNGKPNLTVADIAAKMM